MTNRIGIILALVLIGCGDVETAKLDNDGGDGAAGAGGDTGAAGGGGSPGGSTGSGGTGGASCDHGSEGCPCYGNGTCDGALVCASHLCVSLGAGGRGGMAGGQAGTGGSSAGRGGTTGTGNTTGAAGSTGTGNVTGGGGAGGSGVCPPVCSGGSTCVGGQCVCPGSKPLCGSTCCASGQACTNNQCVSPSTGTAGATGAGGSGVAAWYCPGGTDVTCITEAGLSKPCTARCVLGANQRGTQPDGSWCTCFFHATGTGNYTECQPDSYCGP